MATFNATTPAVDVLSSSVAAAAAEHFERTAAAAAFIVPSASSSNAPLHLESFVSAAPHFVGATPNHAAATHTAHHHHHHHQQQTNSTSSSYTFVQIKREPCQVSEVTTSNNCHQQQQSSLSATTTTTQQHHGHSVGSASSTSSTSKTMSSSTLTTLVKIEASSPKVQEMDKGAPIAALTAAPAIASTNNSVPIGIAVARKRPQETNSTLGSSTALPMQQSLNKDMNCFGIRVADLGGVGAGCGNIYFTGNGDLMTGSATAEELALSAAGVQSVNRAPSTFWQYPNALPIESVISMSPATVGLQYSREASRGQVVLLPATAAALDPFQQAAAAFVWPSYIPQGTAPAPPPPNFIFPSMSPHSTLQPQPYATSLQLFGSNYLTAAAAAAAAAAATSTLCQHNQQTNSSSSSINLSLGAPVVSSSSTTSSSTTSSRFLSVATAAAVADAQKQQKQHLPATMQLPTAPLLVPPTAMKIEEWNATEFMAASAKTTTTTLSAATHQNLVAPPTPALNFETRDKTTTTTTTTTNLLELQGNTQALNLMRLPTPPTSATIEGATVATNAHSLQPQILFQATNSPTPALLNLSATLPRNASNVAPAGITANFLNSTTTTLSATIGPPTPLADEALNFKTGPLETASVLPHPQSQIVVGVPRVVSNAPPPTGPPPQMQDVNIQTDTPVCSEDENSSCPLAVHQMAAPASTMCGSSLPSATSEYIYAQDTDAQQPLELTKSSASSGAINDAQSHSHLSRPKSAECHNDGDSRETENSSERQLPGVPIFTAKIEYNRGVDVPAEGAVTSPVRAAAVQGAPEDLTGLELLSNISTSTLVKNGAIRVKQEPVDHGDVSMAEEPQSLVLNPASIQNSISAADNRSGNTLLAGDACSSGAVPLNPLLNQVPVVEPLGGLNLLCALAEQRIQEEVQSNGLFAPQSGGSEVQITQTVPLHQPPFIFKQQQSPFRLEQSFPSMEGIELPSTSGVSSDPVKRKKHKHSKSSKSSSSNSMTGGKKAQRCSKKNKKKYSKEKRKHKQLPTAEELDFEDEQLQEEWKSAFNCVDPEYSRFGKWPDPQKIFNLMESNLRMRLADITRQYRKKKRKLDEISKSNKKKKKCSKLLAQQQTQSQTQTQAQVTSLTLGGPNPLSLAANGALGSSGLVCASTSSPLCDYKFLKFSKTTVSTTSAYMNPPSFLRFADKAQTHVQFPPPDVNLGEDEKTITPSHTPATPLLLKPVRLEPSALATTDNRGTALRLAQKHASSEKSSQGVGGKERKLMASNSRRSSDNEERNAITPTTVQQQQQQRKPNPIDRELMLTSEHLYRKETRVLTDMGGLFYAGIMKPLQPPDVYAITLDGERGNKSHIMSREEIFKDTILEIAPKSVESVPVGTRLCAYWSQQYRCLYPGRAIESETSDDDSTSNDFVSVEFDDGDSGRIRLQNIRLLLSDYPIAEYNDNPLYSLGKQKKSSIKSINGSDGIRQAEQMSAATSGQQNTTTTGNGILAAAHNVLDQNQSPMEFYAKRSGKKRNKALKKKAQATANGGINVATVAAGEISECSRKHHKHKKRKKHKKHHRKGIIEADGKTYVVNVVAAAAAAAEALASKCEVAAAEEELQLQHASEEDDVEQEQTGSIAGQDEELSVTQLPSAAAAVKLEVSAPVAVKVKTEQLDMEEESVSNMMSEVSDENKCDDEIEHNNSKGSKIAAFLPDRQLWGWLGKAYRKAGVKGRARKQFYKTIKRGKETITVGDCAVFLSTGRPDRPYIGRIESMWETTSSNKIVRVRWFYHPEETTGCPNLKYPGALFESPHEDENDVQTISHHCEVLPFVRYFAKFGADSKQYQSIYDNNDTYYLAGYYNPRLQVLTLQDDIPTLEEQNTTITANATVADV